MGGVPESDRSEAVDGAMATRRADFDARLALAQGALRAFAGRLLGRTNLAQEIDDVVQETLTRALRSAHTHDEARALEPWLCGICVRVAADRHRARQMERLGVARVDSTRLGAHDVGAGRRGTPTSNIDAAASEPAERGGQFAVDARDELVRRLARLGRRERAALVAFHRDGWSVARIAAAMGAPTGTVKSLLSRARRALAADADEDGGARGGAST